MTILLVRHTQVALHWRGKCYGTADAGLSREGHRRAASLAREIAAWQPDIVVHSNLRRTRSLARRILAQRIGLAIHADPLWQERDFGCWEAQSWARIHRDSGNAMDGMITAPDSFRPGGGETTHELADRAEAAFAALAALPAARIAVITHGGPIAAILGRRAGLAAHDWLALVPACGTITRLSRDRPPLSGPFADPRACAATVNPQHSRP